MIRKLISYVLVLSMTLSVLCVYGTTSEAASVEVSYAKLLQESLYFFDD